MNNGNYFPTISFNFQINGNKYRHVFVTFVIMDTITKLNSKN